MEASENCIKKTQTPHSSVYQNYYEFHTVLSRKIEWSITKNIIKRKVIAFCNLDLNFTQRARWEEGSRLRNAGICGHK